MCNASQYKSFRIANVSFLFVFFLAFCSNFTSGLAVLKILKDRNALTSNSEGNVTMKEASWCFNRCSCWSRV